MTSLQKKTLAPALRLHPLALAAACLLASAGPVQAQAAAALLPQGLQVRQGQAQVQVQGQQMTVRNSANAILDWQSFSIGAGQGVHFEQANAQSKVLNRVSGGEASQIFGSLSSNGQVWLINPSGVLFGREARVDVSSLLVSTLQLGDADFLAGRYLFRQQADKAGLLRNEGRLRSAYGGQIALLGGRVENAGLLDSPGGSQLLAGARSLELVDTGLPHLALRVDVPAGEVLNLGELSAADGRIDVHATVVNQQGLMRANRVERDDQGRISLRASQALNLGADSRTEANGSTGGRIELDAGAAGTALLQGRVSAAGSSGQGGQVSLLGQQLGLLNGARIDVSGASGGGEIFIGGGLQGRDARFANARSTFMAPGAELRADAGNQGDGGRIILWSNAATRAFGSFSARGGAEGGRGGFVETSGGWLDARPAALDLGAARGSSGQWLLDPYNIVISDNASDSQIGGAPTFTAGGAGSSLSTATLAAALNAGNSVTVSTGNAGTEAGDIHFSGNLVVAPSQPVTLTLQSARNTTLDQATLRSTGAALNLDVQVAGNGSQGRVSLLGSRIGTRGGNVFLGGAAMSAATQADGRQTTAALYAPGGANQAGVELVDSQLSLGTGHFSAYGTGGFYGVVLENSEVQAGQAMLQGHGRDGVMINRNSAISARSLLSLEGSGTQYGVLVAAGSRLILNGTGQAGAQMRLQGQGGSQGVGIWDASLGGQAGGTPIQVIGGRLDIVGEGLGDAAAVNVTGGFGAGIPVNPTLELSQSSWASISAKGAGLGGLQLSQVRIAGPSSGSGLFIRNDAAVDAPAGAGRTSLHQVVLQQNGAGSNIEGVQIGISDSDLRASRLFLLSHPGQQTPGGVMQISGSRLEALDDALVINGSNGSLLKAQGMGSGVRVLDSQLMSAQMLVIDAESEAGRGISITNSLLQSGQGQLLLQAKGGGGAALWVEGKSQLRGSELYLRGQGGVELRDGQGGQLLANLHRVDIQADTGSIRISGDWQLQSPELVRLAADGPGASAQIDGPVGLNARLRLTAERIQIGAAGSITSAATGDALSVEGRSLINQGGAAALQAPNGRWLLALDDPSTTALGPLAADWTQYGIGRPELAAMLQDVAGNLRTELPGSGVFFAPTVASLLNGASTGLVFSKPQDGNVKMPMDGSLVGASQTAVGLLPGHALQASVTVNGAVPMAHFADAKPGVNKPLTLDPSTTVKVIDANGKPVLGYSPLSFTGSIVAAPAPRPMPELSGAVAKQAQFALDASLASQNPQAPASTPEQGRSLDATSAVAGNESTPSFAGMDLSRLSRLQQRSLLAARDEFKKQLFADSLHRLELDPSLAEVRPCQSLSEIDSGDCLLTAALKGEARLARELREARQLAGQQPRLGQRRVKRASVPLIERKFAVLVGINAYSDPRIPQLSSAAPDARAMSQLLEQRFGYETVLVEDAGRAAIIQALNRVALEAGPRDSVVVYYAGHGMLSSETGMGYWLPADSRSDDPANWLSNADINRLGAQFGARQFMLISDSCYSGSLAGKVAVGGDGAAAVDDAAAQALLQRKAAVVLSSGGNEPVADSGRDGHSIFAWHLLRSLEALPSWRGGQQVFQAVRADVMRSFPQTPHYGAAGQIGHEAGSDYLFERRELEEPTPAHASARRP